MQTWFWLWDKKLDNLQVLENDTESVTTQVYQSLLEQQVHEYAELKRLISDAAL